ncbi:hypothetical protein BpHYR1_007092 [Brachionus plicatilis]|uniref:Uncharacterized protein n=1 Tax=Brachionus plicatilis TaxID=10195 RepID=A0A3M7SXF3_BRAPC|nr:hypothetical protein BpHYR1_007092 [Brachionus plicatilis]
MPDLESESDDHGKFLSYLNGSIRLKGEKPFTDDTAFASKKWVLPNIIYFYELLTDAFSDLFHPQKIDYNQNIQLDFFSHLKLSLFRYKSK